MRLENQFEVDADIERTWRMLTDLEQVMPCIPGASMDGREGDSYRGNVKIKVGPIGAHLHGTARFESCDDASHQAVIRAIGKDTKGSASVNTAIQAHLEKVDAERTRVVLLTDLDISGRMAQFGRGAIADVSNRILTQFAGNIGARLNATPSANTTTVPVGAASSNGTPVTATTNPQAAPAAPAATEMRVLDLVLPMIRDRYGKLLVGLAVGAPLGFAAGWVTFGRASR